MDILYLRDTAVLGFINGVVDAVTPLLPLPGFKDYPVTAEDLDKLSKDAASFNSILGKNKVVRANSSVASNNIDAPDFVEGYFKAKKIEDTGIRHSGIVAVITDKEEAVIRDASITLRRKKTVKTAAISEEGTYEIIKCAPGNWKLTIVAPGYETGTIDVKISCGKIQKLSITLQSNAIELPGIHTA